MQFLKIVLNLWLICSLIACGGGGGGYGGTGRDGGSGIVIVRYAI